MKNIGPLKSITKIYSKISNFGKILLVLVIGLNGLLSLNLFVKIERKNANAREEHKYLLIVKTKWI